MLPSIPSALLKDSAVIKVCIGMDVYQSPTWQTYAVKNVHLQNTNEVRKTADNTEVVLRSVLYIDGRRSLPVLNYETLVKQSLAAGKPMRAVVTTPDGNTMDYEVLTVDPVPDVPATRTHHIELGCV